VATLSILKTTPNPDLEKINIADRGDLERFFNLRTSDSIIQLYIPDN
jgi:hypothetical protein